jgi:hypothetical protein
MSSKLLQRRRRSKLLFHWGKTRESNSLEGLAVWTLSLDLVSSSNRRRGALAVHRLYSQRDLQLDINLLTTAFPIALADALDRALQHTVQVIPHPGQDEQGFVAAQAG